MIQPLKTDDRGTVRPDSISFPLCPDYTFIREPVSLPWNWQNSGIQRLGKELAYYSVSSSVLEKSPGEVIVTAFASLFMTVASCPQIAFL